MLEVESKMESFQNEFEQGSELQEWTAPQANVSLVSQLTQGTGGSYTDGIGVEHS